MGYLRRQVVRRNQRYRLVQQRPGRGVFQRHRRSRHVRRGDHRRRPQLWRHRLLPHRQYADAFTTDRHACSGGRRRQQWQWHKSCDSLLGGSGNLRTHQERQRHVGADEQCQQLHRRRDRAAGHFGGLRQRAARTRHRARRGGRFFQYRQSRIQRWLAAHQWFRRLRLRRGHLHRTRDFGHWSWAWCRQLHRITDHLRL